MFRKNYIPNVTIQQSAFDNGWTAFIDGDFFTYRALVALEDGTYAMSMWTVPTRFETFDALMESIYEYACYKHIKSVKSNMKNSKVSIKL